MEAEADRLPRKKKKEKRLDALRARAAELAVAFLAPAPRTCKNGQQAFEARNAGRPSWSPAGLRRWLTVGAPGVGWRRGQSITVTVYNYDSL